MRKFYALALCAGIASVLAVIYVLLHLDWNTSPPPQAPPASTAPEDAGKGPSASDGEGGNRAEAPPPAESSRR